jgi:hypothetical protein
MLLASATNRRINLINQSTFFRTGQLVLLAPYSTAVLDEILIPHLQQALFIFNSLQKKLLTFLHLHPLGITIETLPSAN